MYFARPRPYVGWLQAWSCLATSAGAQPVAELPGTPWGAPDLRGLWNHGTATPLDGRPQLPSSVRQWLGDAGGRWEGDTLVVETGNSDPRQQYRGWSRGNVRLTERYTRVGADTLRYAVTFEDAEQWASPWTAEILRRPTAGPMFEYACHEANVGLTNTLAFARGEDGTR